MDLQMSIELKLFRLQQYTHPEWGKSILNQETYFLASDIQKVKDHLGEVKIFLDENGIYKRWYAIDRCEEEYTLKEVDCKMLYRGPKEVEQ